MAAPSSIREASYERMGISGGVIGFGSDFATLTSTDEDASFPITRLQEFLDLGLGYEHRSTGITTVRWDLDFGSDVSVNYVLIEGVRGVVAEADYGSVTPVEVLTLAAAPPPATVSQGFMRVEPIRGNLWLTFDTVTARSVSIEFHAATNGLGFFAARRMVVGEFTPFVKTYLRGFTERPRNNNIIGEAAFGNQNVRFRKTAYDGTYRFPYVGADAAEPAVWRPFVGWEGDAVQHLNPHLPFAFLPAPDGSIIGDADTWFGPRFAYLTQDPRRSSHKDTCDDTFDITLRMRTLI